MDAHGLIYLGIALSYYEGAIQNFVARKYHRAIRDLIIAALYTAIAFLVEPQLLVLSQG